MSNAEVRKWADDYLQTNDMRITGYYASSDLGRFITALCTYLLSKGEKPQILKYGVDAEPEVHVFMVMGDTYYAANGEHSSIVDVTDTRDFYVDTKKDAGIKGLMILSEVTRVILTLI